MIRGLIFIMIMWELPNPVPSQGENNLWYFGDSAGIDFNFNPPLSIYNPFYSDEGSSTICDKNGNLLFYCNPVNVFDKNHQLMMNGNIAGNQQYSITQMLTIRQPGTTNIYYVFNTDEAFISNFYSEGFRYSIVDLSLNGGLGAVIANNQVLFYSSTEKVTAIRHLNGTDFWIICHEWNNNVFRAYKLTCSGLDTNYISSAVGSVHIHPPSWCLAGSVKATADGNFIATAISCLHQVELFKFDAGTGVISSAIKIQNLVPYPYGIEFSPDGSKMYVGSSNNSDYILDVFQFDISNYNDTIIIASMDSLGYSSTNPDKKLGKPGALQYAADGRIYVSRRDTNFLAVIGEPDSSASNCNFSNYGFQLFPGTNCNLGLPHRNPSGPDAGTKIELSGYCGISDTLTGTFYCDYIPDSLRWKFGDPSSGPLNTATDDTTFHIYQNPGTYIISLISYRKCESDTIIDTVTMGAPVLAIADTTICHSASVIINAGPSGMEFLWSTGDTTQTILVTIPGAYSVMVADSNGCTASDTAVVSVSQPAIADFNADFSGCPTITFSDSSSGNPLAWKWYFGDGDSSSAQSPSHTYAGNGKYPLMLIVSDNCGNDTLTDTLDVDCIENRDDFHTGEFSMLVFPNPNSGEFTVEIGGGNHEMGNLSVHNVLGQLITEYPVPIPGAQKINLNSNAAGVYSITLVTERGSMRVKVVKSQ